MFGKIFRPAKFEKQSQAMMREYAGIRNANEKENFLYGQYTFMREHISFIESPDARHGENLIPNNESRRHEDQCRKEKTPFFMEIQFRMKWE